MKSSAALLVIGDEILSGKVKDENSFVFTKTMYEQGVTVERIEVIPDIEEIIAERVNHYRARHTYVATSGGVGPTHDDRTLQALSQAFKSPLKLHEASLNYFKEAQIKSGGKDVVSEAQLRMLRYPEVTKVFHAEPSWLPLLVLENVYVFPGVPSLFRQLLESFSSLFVGGKFYLSTIFTDMPETKIAPALSDAAERFSAIKIGSYPQMASGPCRVIVTVEGEDEALVEEVTLLLVPLLDGRCQ